MSFIALGQSSPYWKEAVADVASLPSVGGVTGECRLVLDVDEIYEWNGSSWESVSGGGGGSGDVVGPASATDNAVARFDTTTGKLIQNSGVTISDTNVVSATGVLVSGLTASRAVQTDASKNLESSAVTSTQLSYVDFTSSGQTQLNAKQGLDATLTALAAYNTNGILTQTAADTFAGRTITGTANEVAVSNGDGVAGNPTLSLPTGIDAAKIADGSVSSTEFQYISTLSSNAQTQLDAKAPLVSPSFTTPSLGVATATSINKMAITAPATSSTLAVADGKTLTASNTLTFTGTDSSSVAFGAGGTVAYTANKLSAFAATSSAELAGVISDETGSGALVFGTSPALTTPTATQLDILAQGSLRLQDSSGGEYIGMKAAATTTTYTLTMPAAVPGASQVLADAGAGDGVMAWVANGGGTPTPTASTTSQWDASVNMSANNFIPGASLVTKANGTTTLTVTSPKKIILSGGGGAAQTVVLPVTSTLAVGFEFEIINQDAGTVTVQSSGLNTIRTLLTTNRGTFTCILTSGTGTASWDHSFPATISSPSAGNGVIATWGGSTVKGDSGTTLSTTPSNPAASVYNNSNIQTAGFCPQYTTTATAAGTTTLVVTSNGVQYFTGTTTQNCKMPVASTMNTTGMSFLIVNNSTGVVTVQSSGSNTILAMEAATSAFITCILTSGTTAASWGVSQYTRIKSEQTQISRLRSAATSLTTATTVDVCNTTTKLTLPAGKWLIYATVGFSAAATTTVSNLTLGISKTSATLPAADTTAVPTAGEYMVVDSLPALVLNGDYTLTSQPVPITLTASTDYYLVAQGTFGVSTLSVFGSMHAVPV